MLQQQKGRRHLVPLSSDAVTFASVKNAPSLSSVTRVRLFVRKRHHARGSGSNRTGRSAQTSQKSTNILHCRAAAGKKRPSDGAALWMSAATQTAPVFDLLCGVSVDHAGSVRPGQQPRRSDATEARRHDGSQPESNTGQ